MSDDMRQFERIYLTYCDGSYEQPVLWCQDRVDDDDVAYVNVAAFDVQAERIVELEEWQDKAANLLRGALVFLDNDEQCIAELEAEVAHWKQRLAEAHGGIDATTYLIRACIRQIDAGNESIAREWLEESLPEEAHDDDAD